jgi:hypothetical protein
LGCSGNVTYRGAYHYVRTRTNHGDTFVSGQDSIEHGKRYRNYFQVPGFMTEGSVYVRAESPEGRVFEFDADVTSDNWNKFYPNPVTLSYTDNYNRAILGDFTKSEGELYLGGLPLFGVDYTLSILKDESGTAMWQVNGFFGEAQRPLLPGKRHPYLYHDWIDEGEAAAQRRFTEGRSNSPQPSPTALPWEPFTQTTKSRTRYLGTGQAQIQSPPTRCRNRSRCLQT